MVAVVAMLGGVFVGLVGGVSLSVLVFRRSGLPILGPVIAMSVFAPLTLFGTVMIATVTGGLGEDLFGTARGPPVGVSLGCLGGSFVFNSFFGSLGLLGWAIVRLTQGQTDEAG